MNPHFTRRSSRIVVLASLALAVAMPACKPRDPLERARLLQDVNGEFAESLEALREVLEKRPEDPEANYRYGIALIAGGQHSLAKWSLRKAMETPEWVERAGVPLATTAILLGGYDEAIEVCNRVLEQHPDQVEVLLLRADARVRSRRHYEDALVDAERVIELDPDNEGALVPKVVALLGLQRVDEAAAALDVLEGSHSDPSLGLKGSPALCAAQATFAKEKGEVDKAAERFDSCLKLFPSDGLLVHEAVEFFDAIRRYDRSEEILKAALADVPDAFNYRASLVDRYRVSGRAKEAEALLHAATELESPASAAIAWSAIALYSIETGDFDEGARAFERARELDPSGSPEILFGYADALVVAGRHEDALRIAEQMTVPAHRELVKGRVALARGEPAEALAHFSEGNRLWPNNAVSRYYAAAAAEQVGNFERAVEDYRYSMRIDPAATDAYLRLARLQVAVGQFDQALLSLSFESGGHRPGGDEAQLLELELLARTNRPASPELLARVESGRRGAAAAALSRGFSARLGAGSVIEFIRQQDDLDLKAPENSDALAALVEALIAKGKGKDALARVDAALAAHPEAAVFHALHGDVLAATGADTAAVRTAYQRALEIDAEEHRALAGIAGLEAKAGAAESALAFYERAALVDKSDRESVRAAAQLLVGLGRADEAEARLKALLREYPYDAQAALALAELRRARGAEADGTRELARRAVRFGGGASAQALLEQIDAERAAAAAPAAKAG